MTSRENDLYFAALLLCNLAMITHNAPLIKREPVIALRFRNIFVVGHTGTTQLHVKRNTINCHRELQI